ncbi:MAG: hydrolase family protein [Microbacteriaceae bacterium]|nr:hydrolase family protein [Microbacteriaceae bacterium]
MGRMTLALAATAAVSALLLTGCTAAQPHSYSTRHSTPKPTSTSSGPLGLVVLIGDSIMRGHGLSADEAWPQLLAADQGWTIDNLGCDSAGFLADGNENECDGDYSALVTAAIALDPTTVFIQGSSNDFGWNDDALAGATTQDVQALRAALPKARIIGLSTIWSEGTPPDQLADVNGQVESAVTAVGGTYLDLGQPLGGHPEWMQSDDVHPTADGQVAIMQAVKSALDAAGLSRS